MVIIIDNNLLLDLIFGFVQEKRRNLVNIRKNLVYVWIILFETVFGQSYFSRTVRYLSIPVSVWACFIFEPVWCDVPCLSKGPYFKGNHFIWFNRSFPCRLDVGRTDFKFKFTRSEKQTGSHGRKWVIGQRGQVFTIYSSSIGLAGWGW